MINCCQKQCRTVKHKSREQQISILTTNIESDKVIYEVGVKSGWVNKNQSQESMENKNVTKKAEDEAGKQIT